eukprot:TRINITY_DN1418_c0_g1_i1.p1 TRINITY_DN1418_c0_g1~~TRINITY_DN1418_c0_g1_i1.p1  ORF type:complete len:3212 (-),score=1062.70 TRINITY_DN1418_c0_g1_i1:26-9661(-)
MFEGLVSDQLIKYLGQYIKNLNKENLKIGIWGGDVILENLELKEEALNSLNLPFGVKKGFLGKLKLKVPWKNLKSQPVIVLIENVFLVAQPDYSYAEYDEKKEQEKAAAAKRNQLANAEAMKSFNASLEEGADEKANKSFVESLATKIVDNLQVEINNIHIRFEDFTTSKEFPFAVGVCLGSLKLRSTDENWKEMFVNERVGDLIYKLARMEHLSVYMNPCSESLSKLDNAQLTAVFNNLIARDKANANNHHFILNPVTASLKLVVNTSKNHDMKIPKLTATLVFEDISVELEELQYQTVLKLVDTIGSYEKGKAYLKFRPLNIRPNTKEGARAWWRYACNSVRMDVHNHLERRSWKYILQRRRDRKSYIDLYKRSFKLTWQKPLTKPETTTLEELEAKLSYDDIIFFRSLAEAEMKKEAQNAQVVEAARKAQVAQKGFFTRVFSSAPKATEKDAASIELTAEERAELYRTIDFQEVIENTVLPKEYVQFRAFAEIKSTSLSLFVASRESRSQILFSGLSSIKASAEIRPTSMKASLNVKELRVDDTFTQNSQFRAMVSHSIKSKTSQDLLQLIFEQNPLDGHADLALDLKTAPLDIVIVKPILERIVTFFVPQVNMAIAGDIRNAATQQLNNLKESSKAQLEDSLKNHKTLDVHISISAPTIIVPEDVTRQNTPLLALDLGQLNVGSHLHPTKALHDKSEEEFYDRFDLALTDIKVLLVPDMTSSWRDSQFQKTNRLQIIEDFQINIRLEKCIQPDEINYTQIKVSGKLPQFKLNVSPKKLGQIVKLIKMLTADLPAAAPVAEASTATNYPTAAGMPLEVPQKETQVVLLHNKNVLAKRKIVEAKFEISNINITVSHNRTDAEIPVVVLIVERLGVTFVQRTYDMFAEINLLAVKLEDRYLTGKGEEVQYVATSHLVDDEEDRKTSLIYVRFQQTSKESPDYKGVETAMDFQFSSFYLIINRETASFLIEFILKDIMKAIEPLSATPPPPNRALTSTPSKIAELEPGSHHEKAAKKISPRGDVVFKLNATMKNVTILINTESQLLAEFSIRDVGVSVATYRRTMEVKGQLGDMSLVNMLQYEGAPEHYSNIMSVVRTKEDEAMLSFSYRTFDQHEEGWSGYNASIGAEMKSVRFIFLNNFVMELQRYFTEGPIMRTLTDITKEKARESAISGAQQIAENTTAGAKNLLNVTIFTPEIVIPKASNSLDHILFQVGKLTLTNTFKPELPVETMKITLTSTNITSVIETVSTPFLTDFGVDLMVERLLDNTYNDRVPQFKISMNVGSINFLLSKPQSLLLVGILNGNLKETSLTAAQTQPAQIPASPTLTKQNSSLAETISEIAAQKPQLFVKAVVDLYLEKISFSLVEHSPSPNDGSKLELLATFDINALRASVKVLDDLSLDLTFTLASIVLSDTRSNTKNHFKQILSRDITASEEESKSNLLQVKFSRSKVGDMDVNVDFVRPSIVVVPDLLYAIKDFFMDVGQSFAQPPPAAQTEIAQPEAAQQSGNIHAVINVVDPEIIVVHDPTRVDSKAIVVKSSFFVEYNRRMQTTEAGKTEPKDEAKVKVTQMQAFVTHPKIHSSDVLHIIHPFSVAVSFSSFNYAMAIDVNAEPLSMFITYQDFKMTMGILNALKPLQPPPTSPMASPAQPSRLSRDPSVTTIKSHSSYGSTLSTSDAMISQSVNKAVAKALTTEKLNFKCTSFLFSLINDYQGRYIPLTELRISEISATVSNWSSNMVADAGVTITADYFNQAIVQYEPLIEYWSCDVKARTSSASPKMSIDVNSKHILNLNVTHAFVETLSAVLEVLNKDYYLDEADSTAPIEVEEDKYSPYWIVNDSGAVVQVLSGQDNIDIPIGQKIPLESTSKGQKIDNSSSRSQRLVSLKVGTSENIIRDINLEKVGRSVYVIQFADKDLPVLCEIRLVEGSKILTVSSLVLVKNNTSIALEVGIRPPAITAVQTLGPIAPGGSASIPIALALDALISIRPKTTGNSFKWPTEGNWMNLSELSMGVIGKSGKQKKKGVRQYLHAVPQTDESKYPFRTLITSTVKTESQGFNGLTLLCSPPLIIENLLPCPFKFQIFEESVKQVYGEITSGDSFETFSVHSLKDLRLVIGVPGFPESNQSLINNAEGKSKDLSEKITLRDEKKKTLVLRIDNRLEDGSRRVSIYAPFWIINKTDLKMLYRQSVMNNSSDEPVFGEDVNNEKPVMFSYSGTDAFNGGKLVVKTSDSKWSKPFSIDNAGTNGVVNMSDDKNSEYQIGVNLYLGEGNFNRTKIVEFSPSHVFVNESEHTIILKQSAKKGASTNREFVLKPGEKHTLYTWSTAKGAKRTFCLKYDDKLTEWSSDFSVSDLGHLSVKMKKNQTFVHAKVDVSTEYITTFVRISDEDRAKAPYKIENNTNFDVSYYQSDTKNLLNRHELPMKCAVPYTWDQPMKKHKLKLVFKDVNMKPIGVYMNVIDTLKPVVIKGKTVYIYVRADGPTRILCLTEDKRKMRKETFADNQDDPDRAEIVDIDFKANLAGFGLSVIDRTPREMLYISARGLDFSYSSSNYDQKMEIKLQNFQIDNQLADASYPVMLSYVDRSDSKVPFFHLSMVKSIENQSIDFFSYFSVLIQEMSVKVDDQLLNALLAFFKELNLDKLQQSQSTGPPRPAYPPVIAMTTANDVIPLSQIRSSDAEVQELPPGHYYFSYSFYPRGKMGPISEKFISMTPINSATFTNLQPMKNFTKILYISSDAVNFRRIDTISPQSVPNGDLITKYKTIFPDYKKNETRVYDGQVQHDVVRPQEEKYMYFKIFLLNPIKLNITFNMTPGSLNTGSSNNPLRIAVQLVGNTFANLDNAPLRLNALMIEEAFTTQKELVSRITQHYTRQGMQEVYKILGSADFLGNPVGLLGNLGTGVVDFFVEPAQGLIKSPQDFGKGLAKGTSSLVKNTIYGTFNTVSKLTGTAGKGIAALSMDDDYINNRQRKAVTDKPKHAAEGVFMGAKEFGKGLAEGIGGLVYQPIKGSKKEGVKGFFKGIGKGLVGVGVKPVVGAIDLVSKTTEGIKNTTTVFDKKVERVRPPRYIGLDNTLSSYAEKESRGLQFLNRLNDGQYRGEAFTAFEEIENDYSLLITNQRIIIVEKGKENWSVELKDVTQLDLVKMGVLVRFNHEPNVGIIRSSDPAKSLMIYTKITACVKQRKKLDKKLKGSKELKSTKSPSSKKASKEEMSSPVSPQKE